MIIIMIVRISPAFYCSTEAERFPSYVLMSVSQISSVTSMRASNTKTPPKKPATHSTRAGTPRAPSTANSVPSPISVKRVAG